MYSMKKRMLSMLIVAFACMSIGFGAQVDKLDYTLPGYEDRATFYQLEGEKVKLVNHFNGDIIRVRNIDFRRYAFMNKAGAMLTGYDYTFASNFTDGRAFVKINYDKAAYIDIRGDIVIELPSTFKFTTDAHYENGMMYYSDVSFKEGVVKYFDKDKSKYGLMDINGEPVSQYRYDRIYPFYDGKAVAEMDGKLVTINPMGEVIIELPFTKLPSQGSVVAGGSDYSLAYVPGFRNGVMVGYNDLGEMGAVNDRGEMIIEFGRYDGIYDAHDGYLKVMKETKDDFIHGIVTLEGKELIAPLYRGLFGYSENRMLYMPDMMKNQFGYFDELGQVAIEPRYFEDASGFSDGLAQVEINRNGQGNTGFIDKNGDVVIQPTYSYAGNFSNGYTYVKMFYEDERVVRIEGRPRALYIIDKEDNPIASLYGRSVDSNRNGVYSMGGRVTVMNDSALFKKMPYQFNDEKIVMSGYEANGEFYVDVEDLATTLSDTTDEFAVFYSNLKREVKIDSTQSYEKNWDALSIEENTQKYIARTPYRLVINGVDRTGEVKGYEVDDHYYYELDKLSEFLNVEMVKEASLLTTK